MLKSRLYNLGLSDRIHRNVCDDFVVRLSYCIAPYHSIAFCMRQISNCISLYQTVSYCIRMHRTVSYCIVLYQDCIVLQKTVSYCIRMHRNVLYHTAPCCIRLYRTV